MPEEPESLEDLPDEDDDDDDDDDAEGEAEAEAPAAPGADVEKKG